MERDFLGLGSKNVSVRDEASYDHHGSKCSVAMRGPTQWSFFNNGSTVPQFLSFKGSAGDKLRKTVDDPSTFMSISTAHASDSNHKQYPTFLQKSLSVDKQGNQYGTTNSVNHQESWIFPFSNQQNRTISVRNQALHHRFIPGGHNLVADSVASPFFGGVPFVDPVSVIPAATSVVGTTELRDVPKSCAAPSQLTIFYNGSVCVYDDVTPEKAQAIMSVAGNGSSLPQNVTPQLQRPIPRPCTADNHGRNNKNTATSSCSGLPSPISISSSSASELTIGGPVVASVCSRSQAEPTTMPLICVSGTSSPAGAFPQARKASLTRFLEKRKERVTSTSPYNSGKKSPERETLVSTGISLSINSSSSFASSGHQLAADGRPSSLRTNRNM